MKTFGLLMAATALFTVSCSSPEKVEEEVVEINYSLDKENSTIKWMGMMSPEYFHTGTVSLTEGSITMTNGELTSGSFVVDMSTITNTDLVEEKGNYLEGHLMGTMVDEDHPENMFFQVPKYPTVKVTLGEYKDGMLTTTLDILGQKVTQDVKANITTDDNGAKITGKFKFDFTPLNIPGLQANPDTGEGISPMVEFDINIVLTK